VTATLQSKFAQVRDSMKTHLVERDPAIDLLILSVIAKTHLFFLGTPGIAKSMAIRNFQEHLDLPPGDYFEILMMRQTTREEVFGPLDLMALKDPSGSRYVFRTKGYLPESRFAFLDEIWKANSAILNALLMATNERLFRNDSQVNLIPLWSVFMASNELPEGEELNAIYDRVTFRLYVNPIVEAANFEKMLKMVSKGHSTPEKILTFPEIEQAHNEAMQVNLGQEIFDALQEVRADLASADIYPTDRRFANSLSVIKAAAWLDGETVADIEHIRPLMHVLWDDPKDFPEVEKKMLTLANPFDQEALELLSAIRQIGDELDKTLRDNTIDPDVLSRKGVELHTRVEDARNDLNKLDAAMTKANSKRRSSKFQECKTSLLSVTRRLLKHLFNTTEAELDEAAIGGQ